MSDGSLSGALRKSKQGFWSRLGDLLRPGRVLAEGDLSRMEEALVTADFGVETSMAVLEAIDRAWRAGDVRTVEAAQGFLRREILRRIAGADRSMRRAAAGPTVVLFCGVNGSGKTTSLGKLAALWRSEGRQGIVAAADTFRAAAIEQVKVWADRAGVPCVAHQPGGDAGAVAFDAVQAATGRGLDFVLIDTAGRLQTAKGLMQELGKVARVVGKAASGAPHETLLVLDATGGQNAIAQAEAFAQATPLTGLVLTKLDGTARGGIALAVEERFKVPVKWVGIGEGVGDLAPFDPERFVEGILGSQG